MFPMKNYLQIIDLLEDHGSVLLYVSTSLCHHFLGLVYIHLIQVAVCICFLLNLIKLSCYYFIPLVTLAAFLAYHASSGKVGSLVFSGPPMDLVCGEESIGEGFLPTNHGLSLAIGVSSHPHSAYSPISCNSPCMSLYLSLNIPFSYYLV